jgi:hypothetical protein
MVLDVGISDMLSVAQTVGIVGTLLIALFLSRREVKDLSIFISNISQQCVIQGDYLPLHWIFLIV